MSFSLSPQLHAALPSLKRGDVSPLFPTAPVSYAPLDTGWLSPFLCNYLDARLFGTPDHAKLCAQHLQNQIENSIQDILDYDDLVSQLENNGRPTIWEEGLKYLPQGLVKLLDLEHCATLPLRFTSKVLPHLDNPLLFMEPWDIDWRCFKKKKHPTIFFFAHRASLLHCLSFPELWEVFADSKNLLWVLPYHPQDLLDAQAPFELTAPLEIPLLDAFLKSGSSCQELYQWMLCMYARKEYERLGPERGLAFQYNISLDYLLDSRKTIATDVAYPLPDPTLYFLNKLPHKDPIPLSSVKRIAHIIPKLADKGHAPSTRLEQFIKHYPKTSYEVLILCTEDRLLRPQEYPFNLNFLTFPSYHDAKELLQTCHKNNIEVIIDDGTRSYWDTAMYYAKLVEEKQIDVAFFHGADPINCLIAKRAKIPRCVFYEHGTLPQYDVFDALILSHKEEKANPVLQNFSGTIFVNPSTKDLNAKTYHDIQSP